jgi:hypothetical protein
MTRHAGNHEQFDHCPRAAQHALRTSAEEMLREMAFVLHLTRAVRDAMTEGPSRPYGPDLTFRVAAAEVSE